MRPSATTGGEASCALLLLPSPIETRQAWAGAGPSARWPIDLAALPPGWVQSGLGSGSGSVTGVPARAGSTSTAASLDRIATRSPKVGVIGFLPFLKTPQPLSRLSATRAVTTRFIDDLPV